MSLRTTTGNFPEASRTELASLAERLTHGRVLKVASLLAVQGMSTEHRLVHLYRGFMNTQHDLARRIRADEWGSLDVRSKTLFAFCVVLHAWHGRGRGQGRAPSLTFPCFTASDAYGQLLEAVGYLRASVDFPDIADIFSIGHEGRLSSTEIHRKQQQSSLEASWDCRHWNVFVISRRPQEEETALPEDEGEIAWI